MDDKSIAWRGSTLRDLSAMPDRVRIKFGYALRMAQQRLRHDDVKSLKGFDPTSLEVLEDHDGDTFRAIYTAKFEDVVYVLHCFKKKSTSGSNLPKHDRETIEARLNEVRRIEAEKAKAQRRGS